MPTIKFEVGGSSPAGKQHIQAKTFALDVSSYVKMLINSRPSCSSMRPSKYKGDITTRGLGRGENVEPRVAVPSHIYESGALLKHTTRAPGDW